MFRVLFLMLILLAGLVAGPYLAGSQGYVRIETDGKIIEMSLVMLVVFFVIAMGAIYLVEAVLSRLCRLNSGAYNWFATRKYKKAQAETIEGLMEMSEGNYAKAEKLFSKNAKHAAEPVLNLIKAAEAAQQKGDELSANKYLIKAGEIGGANNVIVELARTRILVQQGKLPAARSAVDSLLEIAPNNNEVLRLAVQIYQDSKAFHALDRLLESIGQRSFLSNEEYCHLEQQVADGLLDEIMNEDGQEGLLKWWDNQSGRRRKSVYIRSALIQRLIDVEDSESAQEIALETVKKFEDEQLEPLFVQLNRLSVDEESKLVKVLQKRANKANDHYTDDYARALGYIYAREGLYEKAKPHFVMLLDHNECVDRDRIMALHVAEQLRDTELANRIREINLKDVNIEAIPVQEILALPERVEQADKTS